MNKRPTYETLVARIVSLEKELADCQRAKERQTADAAMRGNLFSAMGQPAMILDRQHTILDINDKSVELIGSPAQELIGRKCCQVFHGTATPPRGCPAIEAIQSRTPQTATMPVEALGRHLMVTCSPVLDENGETASIIHIASDVTRTIQLEEQVRQMHKLDALATLTGGIAHRFNNMIGIILGNTELGLADVSPDDPVSRRLKNIFSTCLSARDVVRQLLVLNRLENTAGAPADLVQLVEAAIRRIRFIVPDTITIRRRIAPGPLYARITDTELHQMLANLIGNSVHAISRGGGYVEIRLEEMGCAEQLPTAFGNLPAGRYLHLAVSDSGRGIPQEIHHRVLDPYFTTKDIGQGCGMGLTVVAGIMRSCGGGLTITSLEGSGTDVNLYFPQVDARPSC